LKLSIVSPNSIFELAWRSAESRRHALSSLQKAKRTTCRFSEGFELMGRI